MICKRSYKLTDAERKAIKIALIEKQTTARAMCLRNGIGKSDWGNWYYSGLGSAAKVLPILDMIKTELEIDLRLHVENGE